ncbi:uncharacterized protein UHO2_03611 [Ustilago hordei]|uniref:uncharacterized protein n=1 Tax=Ustilago hordei TaxID=120017 RepID=UPI001A5E4672|nr:uncharacterized protein UHO2_03611 [Ustilago hordei]SYW75217.1 related to APS1 - AP-1 complex subunit, sigma1 subunit, 18 KD [Ustilago hordei]
MSPKAKLKITKDVTQLVLARRTRMCNFLEYKDSKVVYRRYASLFFVTGISQGDNELVTLEIIHRYVEVLDRYFGNVCELDLIFNFQKAYAILDELIIAGEMQESSKKSVLRTVSQSDAIEEAEQSEDVTGQGKHLDLAVLFCRSISVTLDIHHVPVNFVHYQLAAISFCFNPSLSSSGGALVLYALTNAQNLLHRNAPHTKAMWAQGIEETGAGSHTIIRSKGFKDHRPCFWNSYSHGKWKRGGNASIEAEHDRPQQDFYTTARKRSRSELILTT